MRDAELRFATLRLRIEERTCTVARRGADARWTRSCATRATRGSRRRRPGRRGAAEYEVWISDGELVRTYSSAHRLGTQRPVRNRPRGLDDRDFPGHRQGLRAGDARCRPRRCPRPSSTRPATARTCSRRAAAWSPARTSSIGREAILLECDHPRTTELAGDRPGLPHLDRGRSRRPASSSASSRSIGGASPATPRSSSCRPTPRCRRRPSTSSSPPGRRCSTELGPFRSHRRSARISPARLPDTSCPERRARRPDPRAAERGAPTAAQAALRSPRHLAYPRVSRAAPRRAAAAAPVAGRRSTVLE